MHVKPAAIVSTGFFKVRSSVLVLPMIRSLRLPLDFDRQALQDDLARIPADRWINHFNNQDYTGEWSGVALRGPADATHPIQSLLATPGTKKWTNTDLLHSCPYFAEVLSRIESPLLSVRLLRLAPGAIIKEHTDHSLGFEDGEVRLHVPVQTNPRVKFVLDGTHVELCEGETWCLNVNFPHSVTNSGEDFRVHLVADCVVDDWLRRLFHNAIEHGTSTQNHSESSDNQCC